MAIQRSSPERLQRRFPSSNKVLRYSRNEQWYYMEQDGNMLHLLGRGSHWSDHYDVIISNVVLYTCIALVVLNLCILTYAVCVFRFGP